MPIMAAGQSRPLCLEPGLVPVNLTLAESFDRNLQHCPALVTAPGLSARGSPSRQQSDLHRSEVWLCSHWPGLSRWAPEKVVVNLEHRKQTFQFPDTHFDVWSTPLRWSCLYQALQTEEQSTEKRWRWRAAAILFSEKTRGRKRLEPSLGDLHFPNEFSLKVKVRNASPPATLEKGQEHEQYSAKSSGCGEGLSPLHATRP